MGKGVKKVVNKFKKYGTEDMTLHLYKDGRHEMLNELNSQEVEQDIIDWLDAHIPKK
jgi:alpha-beta hydrolase superfamily lysophospholipase